jgi:hypothetical protein
MMKLALTLKMFFFSFAVQAAFGPSTGGGGDVVILPNDSVVLADPFLNSSDQQPNNMPPMRSLNPRLLQAADAYLRASEPILTFLSRDRRSSDLVTTLKVLSTRKNSLRFYAVRNQEELGQFCAPGGRKSYILPNGARIEQVACTAGNETFLVEPLFLRLSIKDQALLLVHERLTTLRDAQGGKNYSAIARFTTGLSLFLSLYREQAKNVFRALNESEQNVMSEFYIATEEIEKRNSEINEDSFQWTAAHIGGGAVHNMSHADPSATVGLNFVIDKNSTIEAGAQLKQTNKLTILENVFVGEGTLIHNVTFNYGKIALGQNGVLSNSDIRGDLAIEDNFKINNFSYSGSGFSAEQGLVVNDFKISDVKLKVAANQKMENGFIDPLSQNSYILGTRIKDINTSWRDAFNVEYFVPSYSDDNSRSTTHNIVNIPGLSVTLNSNLSCWKEFSWSGNGAYDCKASTAVYKVLVDSKILESLIRPNSFLVAADNKVYPAGPLRQVAVKVDDHVNGGAIALNGIIARGPRSGLKIYPLPEDPKQYIIEIPAEN